MTGNVHFSNMQYIRRFRRTGNVDTKFITEVEESGVWDHPYKPSIDKAMGPDKMQLKELKKLVNLNAKLLSIIFERSCRSQSQTSRKSLIYDHLPKKDLGNYTPVRLMFFPGKAVC